MLKIIPWELILKFLLMGVGYAMDKAKITKEAKKSYLIFVTNLEHLGLISVKLNESDRDQINDLLSQRRALDSAGGKTDAMAKGKAVDEIGAEESLREYP